MWHVLVVAVMAVNLGIGPNDIELMPPPAVDDGCVVPVSATLEPCPTPRPGRPVESCVVPVVQGTLVVPRCPAPRPDEGRIVPLQSATVE